MSENNEKATPPKPVTTVTMHHPGDNTAEVFGVTVFDNGKVEGMYGRMRAEEAQGAIPLGGLIMSHVRPVSHAVMNCVNPNVFDVNRILVPFVKAVVGEIAKSAELAVTCDPEGAE